MRDRARIALFFAAILFCLTRFASPPLALALGIALALTLGHPFPQRSARTTKILLQLSIVGLGFGMNLQQVVAAGRTGILFTFGTIAGTLILGFVVGRALRMDATTTHLISSGTAICGGSAIAAVGPVVGATDDEMAVSLGTVFILNSVALFVFPAIGTALGMSQTQFGIWSAIAIHDTSSVAGAASRYGLEALQVATPVKLARALWIVPLTIATAMVFRRRTRVAVPWFIIFFLVASIVRTYASSSVRVWETMAHAARVGLTLTLFLIGAGLSRKALAAVGVRPLLLGVTLWIAISVVSLYVVRASL